MGFLCNRCKPLPSSPLEKCKPAWWIEKWFYSPGFFCVSDFRLVSRKWCGRVWDHYRKWGALPMWCTVSSSSCGSCWPRMGGTTEGDGEASNACNLRRVLLESVYFCLVSKVHKLLYCKWNSLCWRVESMTTGSISQNPILSPTMANEFPFFISKSCRSTSNYKWLLMTSSFRLGLQVQMCFILLGGLKKFLLLTLLLLLFWGHKLN